ncbi:FAS1 domain-containing protein [Jimgerdemannia flammicorona]|uniref:FAS1 domain-containing protein n=1 Tax=Jimgerdemannia flammicorona TaxID=994334 RepID=A0A433CXF6_9FUNG|nr:FAS1 domain-containing protein [Jimgerdemannia flammicorona]
MKPLLTLLLLPLLTFLSHYPPPAVATTTIIDVLSSRAQFSSLITILQHTRMVPLLNSVKTATFLALTNKALANISEPVSRDVMLYHLLNVELTAEDLYNGQVLETAYVRPGYLGDFGHVGQRTKVKKIDWKIGRPEKIIIGGSQITERDLQADNAIIQVIDQLLTPPDDIVKTVASLPALSIFSHLLDLSGLDDLLSQPRPFTVFAPENALSRFNLIEETYLRSEAGRADLHIVIKFHIHEGVLFSEDVPGGKSSLSTLQGEPLEILVEDNSILVSSTPVKTRDIIASNGAIHTLPALLLPAALQWTVRKYLIGLNSTRFVAYLDDVGLGYYLDDTTDGTSFTILAPPDEVFDEEELPAKGSKELEKWMRYHVMPGKWEVARLRDGMLLETELIGEELKGARQRLKVDIEEVKEGKKIRFNQAGLVGEPVAINNNIIYTISQVLPPPPPLIERLVMDLRLSTFITFLHRSGLYSQIHGAQGITLFVPTNVAFTQFDLVTRYLLHPQSKSDLQSVIRYHVADSILYSDDIPTGTSNLPTLDGSEIILNKTAQGHILVSPSSPNKDAVANVTHRDILVSTGTVQIINRVVIPPTLRLTNKDFLRVIHAQTFLDILELANLSHTLLPPADPNTRYTILVPSDRAFSRFNLTKLLNDPVALERVARLHVIPAAVERGEPNGDDDNDNDDDLNAAARFPSLLRDGAEYATLLSASDRVIIRETYLGGGFVIQVAGRWFQDNSQAHVIGVGRSAGGGGVIEIDEVLIPRDIQHGWPGWAVALVTVPVVSAVGVGGWYGWTNWRRWRAGYAELA